MTVHDMPPSSSASPRRRKAAAALERGASAPRPPRAERVQLTPADWIRAATEILIHNGIDAVRVDVLAKQLSVTRGSFYWHFLDRKDLLHHILRTWQEAQTAQIIARYSRQGVQAAALIRELVDLPFHGRSAVRGAYVELAVRAWARRDEMARAAVDEVDAERLAYMEGIFLSLGFDKTSARTRSFMLYCYMQSESLFHNQGSGADKVARRQFVASTLLEGSQSR